MPTIVWWLACRRWRVVEWQTPHVGAKQHLGPRVDMWLAFSLLVLTTRGFLINVPLFYSLNGYLEILALGMLSE